MKQKSNESSTLRDIDNNHLWHPFTPMSAWRDEHAPIITAAEGFELIDREGNRYLDGFSSLWCNVHGHRVPEIDQAIRDQLDRVAHSTLLGLANEPSIRLAKALVDRTPAGMNKVFYSDSGSTAVEIALKIAFQYQRQKPGGNDERTLFVRVGNAYHGDTIGTVSVGGIGAFHAIFGRLLFDALEVPAPVTLRVPEGHTPESYRAWCFAEVGRVIRENHSRIAAFIMEPLVQGAAGMQAHPPGYLKHVRELTTEYKIPLIVDEVAVGFGRTGTMFACEQEGVAPDIMCLAKGITGGYLPLAATLTTDEIFDAFLASPDAGRTFYHGHTYTGNPLGCAAALASLELFDQNEVLENVARLSERLREKLQPLEDHPHVAEVRGRGVMVGIELVENRRGLQPYPAARRIGHLVTLAARKRGIIIRPLGDVIILMPAPAMPAELVDRLVKGTIEAIDEAVY